MKPGFFKKHKTFLILLIFSTVITMWLLLAFVILGFVDYKTIKLSELGLSGDSFNIITSLFTGLAFAGVITSIFLQIEELKATRKELNAQEKHLGEQAKHLDKQQKEMVSQSFDNKFFQMLNMFNTNVNNLIISDGFKNHTGKKAISLLKTSLDSVVINVNSTLQIPCEDLDYLNEFKHKFKEFNDEYNNSFKYYCINLYQILKYVDEQELNKRIKKRYANIIRAQLSSDELALLFYNAMGVIPFSGEKYKKLLEKYAFFEHLSVKGLFDDKVIGGIIAVILKQYDIKVFGSNKELTEQL